MPKKRNFLGGMQNYNAQTGEYEPALKGPNGESPSGFKSFKKQEEKDESFDTVNKKRMGIDKEINKWQEENPEGKVLKGKSAKEIGENAENGTFKLDKEKYPDVEETPYGFIYNVNGESITDLKAQNKKFGMSGGSGFSLTKDGDEVYFETFEDAYKAAKGESGNNDFTSEDYVDDFYDRVSDLQKEINTSGIDDDEYDAEINKLKEELETKKDSMSEDDYNKAKEMLDRFSRPTDDDFDANDEDSIWNAFESGKITEEERNKMLSERSGKIANESFDEINAKRMGKAKKSLGYDFRDRKQSTKNHDKRISELNAKYGKGELNRAEWQDAIELENDRWREESKYWYEHEENPYDKDAANRQAENYHKGVEKQNTNIEPKKLASQIKTVDDVKNLFGEFLNEKEISALHNSKNLYIEVSKQYKGGDNYKIIDDKYIKNAFKNGNGTIKDLEEHIKSNKDNAYFIKIR